MKNQRIEELNQRIASASAHGRVRQVVHLVGIKERLMYDEEQEDQEEDHGDVTPAERPLVL